MTDDKYTELKQQLACQFAEIYGLQKRVEALEKLTRSPIPKILEPENK